MSKRLPYFQSEPAEYLAGDIMFCSYASQGVFSIIKAFYWQKDCSLKLSQVKKRLKGAEELIQELIDENIIKVKEDNISITFLDSQFRKALNKSNANSLNGKKGAKARWNKKQKNSESIATPSLKNSESIALRRDKIKEDKIKEDNNDDDVLFNIDNLILNYKKDKRTFNKVCENQKLDSIKLESYLEKFKSHIQGNGIHAKTKIDFASHFLSWVKIQEKKSNNNTKRQIAF